MEDQLKSKFKAYLNEVDTEQINSKWVNQSKDFRNFWAFKIMQESYQPLTDSEIDQIVLVLDKSAKGSTKDTVAVARAMIPQGVWRRLFLEIKSKKELRELLYSILQEEDNQKQIGLINKLYEFNEGQKNSLTGKSGNALNTMLFAYYPKKYTAVVSLNDRKRVIEHFNFQSTIDFDNDSPGKKLVESNNVILNGFKNLNIDASPYLVSKFLYLKVKEDWKITEEEIEETSENEPEEQYPESNASFYMEKELENFLISNWDQTELAQQYELIEEEGEIVSQQYKTDIGRIDILVRDKKTGQYVVIELKRNQTSDDTIGQITRYMGWLEQHKSNGRDTKGIIIASTYDDRLRYALKKVKDVEVYTYQIDFKLKEFKQE